MSEQPPHLILTIETKDPIEIGDFVGQFTALSSQYEKYIRAHYPDVADQAEIFVTQVKEGSIVAHLVPYFIAGGVTTAAIAAMAVIEGMDKIMILEDFVKRYGGRLLSYVHRGGRDKDANRSDLKDFHNAVAAIANDPQACARLEAAVFEDGEKKIRAAFQLIRPASRFARNAAEWMLTIAAVPVALPASVARLAGPISASRRARCSPATSGPCGTIWPRLRFS
jgi:hypothetical protein